MITLLQDQTDLINAAKDEIRAGCRALLIQGATGSGKTCMASSIVYGAYMKQKICFFIVPRRDLLRQTSNTLKEFGVPHSFIAAELPCDENEKIFVCSQQTLRNRMEIIIPHLVIIDEGHVGGEALDAMIKFYKSKGCMIILLSATPWKLSGKGLGCWVDKMVCGPSVRWLIDNKRLSEFRAFGPDMPDLSGIRKIAGDYAHKPLAERMEGDKVLIGSSVKHYQDHAMGKLHIAYCVSRKHSEIVAQSFRDSGIPAQHMDGDTPDNERIRIIKAYARREIKVLTNCDLLTYGFDLSSASGMNVTVESMSDLRPTLSLALQYQKWGRVLRMKEYPALIFDHANNFMEHNGLPDTPREWTLADRDKKEKGEDTINVRQCEKCFYNFKPAPICPNCGHVLPIDSREIKTVEGELTEIQILAARRQRGREEYQCETLEDWIALAKQRGHQTGWAYHRFKKMKPRKKG